MPVIFKPPPACGGTEGGSVFDRKAYQQLQTSIIGYNEPIGQSHVNIVQDLRTLMAKISSSFMLRMPLTVAADAPNPLVGTGFQPVLAQRFANLRDDRGSLSILMAQLFHS